MITIPGKIPISIHPLFWLVAFFIGWMWTLSITLTLLCVVIILFSVIFHEMGHALTAGLFGQKTRIELAVFGGFTYRQGRKLKLWEEFIVVLNGPLAGFVLFLAAFFIQRTFPVENVTLSFVLRFTCVANFFWTIINLVPVLPLDGGHLMSIILEAIFGFKGVKIAIVFGIVVAVLISIFFFIQGFLLVGALFLILIFESFRSLRYYKIFSEKDRDTDLQQLMQSADEDLQAGSVSDALEKFERVRTQTKGGILFSLATQEMAEIFRYQHQYQQAYDLLLPIQKTLNGSSLALFHLLAYMTRNYQTVLEIGNKCFQENPTHDTALVNALASGALGKTDAAIGWLECALREGLPSLDHAIHREEFNAIRNDPRFIQLQKKV